MNWLRPFLVADMFGPQVNSNTGDYSVGCSGFWFENGEPQYPVSEITIAGNLLDMYKSLVAANDLEFRGATNHTPLGLTCLTMDAGRGRGDHLHRRARSGTWGTCVAGRTGLDTGLRRCDGFQPAPV